MLICVMFLTFMYDNRNSYILLSPMISLVGEGANEEVGNFGHCCAVSV